MLLNRNFGGVSAVFRLHAVAAVCAVACATAQAQSASSTASLKEIVVSGSRSERSTQDVPASIDLIDAAELESRQINNIRALANETPNVSVRRLPNRLSINGAAGKEGNAGFNIRGLEGNRVLLLVDGMRAPRNYSFGASSRDNFDFGLIDHVEIVKGPSSALYGSDGIAGLVQFFTKDPAAFLAPGKNLGGQASLGYSGEDTGVQLGATVAVQANETLQWLVSANVARAQALRNRGDKDLANTDRTTPNPQNDDNSALLAKVVFRPDSTQRHTLSLEAVNKKSDFSDLLSLRSKPPLAATGVLSAQGSTNNQRQRLSWQGQFMTNLAWADEIKASLGYQNFSSREFFANDRSTAGDQIRVTDDKETTIQANFQGEKMLRGAVGHKLVYGLDYAGITADNIQTGQTPPVGETFPLKRFPESLESTTALYLQDEIMGDRWSVTPAVRYDSYQIDAKQGGFAGTANSQSGSAVSPKLAAMFQATPEWGIYGQWATGFRAPSADQLNRFFENLTSFYKTIPNGNLKPEKSRNLELGVKARLPNFKLDAAVFTGKYTDFIVDNQQVAGTGAPGNPIIFQAINIGNATLSGFEVKGDYAVGTWGDSAVSLLFAYGQTKGSDDNTGAPLLTIAPEKLNLGVKYAASQWDVRLDATYRAAKSQADVPNPNTLFLSPSATTLDISGQWRIRKDLRLNVSVTNLTDEKYWNWSSVSALAANSPVIDAYSQPGRSLNVSLVTHF